MEKYISKSALVAEIERRIKSLQQVNSPREQAVLYECEDILSFLDSLEVKEVDLDKEAERFVQTKEFIESTESPIILVAKHFFELGLRSTITEEDCKLIWNIGDEIPNMPEEEFFKELLKRYKAQKGE